jgi:hypothetical protein
VAVQQSTASLGAGTTAGNATDNDPRFVQTSPGAYDRPVRRLVTLALLLALAGCSQDEKLPKACDTTPAAVTRALARAPGDVRLDGVPISECLTSNADAAEVQRVGALLVPVAERLAGVARNDPEGPSATRLGYLIGAVRRGAEGSPGLHAELVRRLEQELGAVDTASPAFRAGERAGGEHG